MKSKKYFTHKGEPLSPLHESLPISDVTQKKNSPIPPQVASQAA
jgi:hypothetical protein